MALSGTFEYHWDESDGDNTNTVEVTYPADLPSDHPDYSKRGTTENISAVSTNHHSQSISNQYVHIQSSCIYNIDGNVGDRGKLCSVIWNSYNSQADSSVSGSIVKTGEFSFDWDFATMTNPYSEAYTQLKTQTGWENLIDA